MAAQKISEHLPKFGFVAARANSALVSVVLPLEVPPATRIFLRETATASQC